MPDWVTVARLVRPHGIRGEVVAEAADWTPEQLLAFPHLLVRPGDREVAIEKARAHQGRLLVKFAGVDTPEAAEMLRGCELCVEREHRPPLEPDEYYFSDLTGCRVVDFHTGDEIGTVSGCVQYGGPVLLEVALTAGGDALIPLAKSICRDVDIQGRRIRAELPEGLLESQKDDSR